MSSIRKNMFDQLCNGPSLLEVSLERNLLSAKINCYQWKNGENSEKEKKIISHPRLANILWKNFCSSIKLAQFLERIEGITRSIGEVFNDDFQIFIWGLHTIQKSLFLNSDRSIFSRFTFIPRKWFWNAQERIF